MNWSVNAAPNITTTTLAEGSLGNAYGVSLVLSGGTAPIVWSTNGPLPPGLSFSSVGRLSGTPLGTGATTFTVRATDTNGAVATRQLVITVVPTKAGSTLSAKIRAKRGLASSKKSLVTSTPSTVKANGSAHAVITVTLRRANGSRVGAKKVTLRAFIGHRVIGMFSKKTNGRGEVRFLVSDHTAQVVTYRATDITDGIALRETVTVAFIASK